MKGAYAAPREKKEEKTFKEQECKVGTVLKIHDYKDLDTYSKLNRT